MCQYGGSLCLGYKKNIKIKFQRDNDGFLSALLNFLFIRLDNIVNDMAVSRNCRNIPRTVTHTNFFGQPSRPCQKTVFFAIDGKFVCVETFERNVLCLNRFI